MEMIKAPFGERVSKNDGVQNFVQLQELISVQLQIEKENQVILTEVTIVNPDIFPQLPPNGNEFYCYDKNCFQYKSIETALHSTSLKLSLCTFPEIKIDFFKVDCLVENANQASTLAMDILDQFQGLHKRLNQIKSKMQMIFKCYRVAESAQFVNMYSIYSLISDVQSLNSDIASTIDSEFGISDLKEKLQAIKLPENLQSKENIKTLFDVLFPLNSYETLHEDAKKLQETAKTILEQKKSAYDQLIEFFDCKNTTPKDGKYVERENDIKEQFFESLEATVDFLANAIQQFTTVREDIEKIQNTHVNTLNISEDRKISDRIRLDDAKLMIRKTVEQVNSSIIELNTLVQVLLELTARHYDSIAVLYTNQSQIEDDQNVLREITKKQNTYLQLSSFRFLSTCYYKSLRELKRRNAFKLFVQKQIDTINRYIEDVFTVELQKRNEFLTSPNSPPFMSLFNFFHSEKLSSFCLQFDYLDQFHPMIIDNISNYNELQSRANDMNNSNDEIHTLLSFGPSIEPSSSSSSSLINAKIEGEINALGLEIKKLQDENKAISDRSKETISKLQRDLESRVKETDQLQLSMEEANKHRQSLMVTVSNLTDEVAKLKSSDVDHSARYEQIITSLRTQIQNLEAKNNDLRVSYDTKIASLEEKLKKEEMKSGDLENQNQTLRYLLSEGENQISESNRYNNINSHQQQIEENYQLMQQKIKLTNEIAVLKKERQNLYP